MKKRNVTFLMIAIILVGMTSLCHAYVAYYNLFVVVGEDNKIYQLKILPNGQILDTYIQYILGGNSEFDYGSLVVSPDNRFLFAASDAIYRYQIQSDGSLVSIGSTTPADSVAITPNEQLDIGGSTIYSLTSTGDLVNGTSGPLIDSPRIDPLGRGLLAISSFSTFSAYTINYNSRTLTMTTTYPTPPGSFFYFAFTPNGKLGFYYSSGWDGLGVLSIDSIFNVSTTQVLNISGESIDDLAVSSNNKFVWATLFGGGIALFNIDTLGNVTDTGQRYTHGGIRLVRITPDQQLAIISYEDPQLPSPGGAIATAFINGDGSLSWTGYTFAFDSAHPTGSTEVDIAIIPVYATGIPEELWKTPPPEITIHDSQKILRDP